MGGIYMLINKVILYSNVLKNVLKDFYVEELGFTLIENNDEAFTIQVGQSELEFVKNNTDEKPFYHFAFNIPKNKFEGAKAWAKSKVAFNSENGEDEVYFEYSDAHSFYFEDPSGNIVEFIARNSIAPSQAIPFSAQSVINISEINITTNDVLRIGQQLIDCGIPVRDDEPLKDDGLNFMGEKEKGSFLLLGSEGRRWIFSDKKAEIFPLTVQIDGMKKIVLDHEGNVNLEKFRG